MIEPELSIEDLTATLTRAVLATSGVARIEPSLGQSLQLAGASARPLNGAAATAEPPEAVTVRSRNGAVQVVVEIQVTGRPAVDVATDVRDSLRAAISAAGHRPGPIDVTVLGIQTAPRPADPTLTP